MLNRSLATRNAMLAAVAALTTASCATPERNPPPQADFDAAALTETLKSVQAESTVVGFAVGVVKGGDLVYAKGFGETALGGGEPVTPRSLFHWASVSKPFVATAIMQLSERGKLDLDARLVDVLPDYAVTDPRQRAITIRQLLLHTAGVPDVDEYGWDNPSYDETALQKWATTQSPRELLFDPGTAREYSNVGFEILGAVIERVSGQSFAHYMKSNIFDPLKMRESTFFYPETSESLRTRGHTGEPGAKEATPHYPYNRRHEPSSTLNTNIEEMARFAEALLAGGILDGERILRTETLEEMWAPRWDIDADRGAAAAMGWVREDRNGRLMLRHFGEDDGYRSALIFLPRVNAALFIAANDDHAPIGPIGRPVLEAVSP